MIESEPQDIDQPQADVRRQQLLYWALLVQLKSDSIAIRLYRNRLARLNTTIAAVKALAASGTIAAWGVWKDFAFGWAAIIAATQVADALKDAFPLIRRHKGASDLTADLNGLLIEAELDWDSISAGVKTDDEIAQRRHSLKRAQLEAERKHFPDGLELAPKIQYLAEGEAKEYFRRMHGVEAADD